MTELPTIHAFFTGSRVYGTPGPESDLDMVLLIDDYREMNRLLNSRVWDTIHVFQHDGSISLKIGKLNLICVSKQEMYDKWREGTRNLLAVGRPVTKNEAIASFVRLGFPCLTASSGEPTLSIAETKADDSGVPF